MKLIKLKTQYSEVSVNIDNISYIEKHITLDTKGTAINFINTEVSLVVNEDYEELTKKLNTYAEK